MWLEKWHKVFGYFSCELLKVWKFAFWLDPFCQSIQIFRWKNTEELCLMKLKSDAKFEEKLSLGSKNDMRVLVNFNVRTGKSGNLQFDLLLLPIAHKVSAWKVQKNYLSWHWKKIQTVKKSWLFIWKMTWGIWRILTWAVESLKICTLTSYFCRKYVMFGLKRYRGVVLWKMTYGFKNDISGQKPIKFQLFGLSTACLKLFKVL